MLIVFFVITMGLMTVNNGASAALISWWGFEGKIFDSAGSNNGTLSGGGGYVAGPAGLALGLDGVNDTARIPHNAPLKPSTAITVNVWIKPDAEPPVAWEMYRKDDADAHHLFSFKANPAVNTDQLVFGLGINGSYVEFGLVFSPAIVGDGGIDNVRLYDHALIAFEILDLFAAQSPVPAEIIWESWNTTLNLNWQPTDFPGTTSLITTDGDIAMYQIVGNDLSQPGYNGIGRWEVLGILPDWAQIDLNQNPYFQVRFTGDNSGTEMTYRVVSSGGVYQTAPWTVVPTTPETFFDLSGLSADIVPPPNGNGIVDDCWILLS